MNIPDLLVLEGERIRIESLQSHHIPEMWDDSLSEEVWRYLPNHFRTTQAMQEIYSASLKSKELGLEHPFVVYDKQLQQYVGSTRFLNISLESRNLEIGWTWYLPMVWRTRVNTETKYLLLKYGFDELQLLRVQLKADTRNTRSNEAIERIGAVREGMLRKDRIMHDGYVRNSYIYSIVREEWPGVQERFEQVLLR
ncbi:GNAT family N-acetyltransferase [Marinicrinis lubricantis]|uniref:GNAT family N-acetyltransferase n=1 Tax=Marinicrinis lubricantis TaxID=2086470 RepID=A0ABW1IR79_9BACL